MSATELKGPLPGWLIALKFAIAGVCRKTEVFFMPQRLLRLFSRCLHTSRIQKSALELKIRNGWGAELIPTEMVDMQLYHALSRLMDNAFRCYFFAYRPSSI